MRHNRAASINRRGVKKQFPIDARSVNKGAAREKQIPLGISFPASISSAHSNRTKRDAFCVAHRHVGLNSHPGEPLAQRLRRCAQILLLGWKAAVGIRAQEVRVVSTAIVPEQNDALDLVRLNQEMEL